MQPAHEVCTAASSNPETSNTHHDTVIIGTGFSGLLAAIGLQRKNHDDFILLERHADIGGTWRDNGYPGAEVDIPTGLYSVSSIPYRFTKRYATQVELLEYTRFIVQKFDLGKHIRTRQSVTQLRYDEGSHHWHITVATGEHYTARFVVDASGVLANPRTPVIAGAQSFMGAQFHTARWDHNVDYTGKRIAVIGSGCSAAQVVPAIAAQVDRLTLFMGKAQWIIPRADRHYTRVERYLMNLPLIRQINRFTIFTIHESRFVGFRRYPFTQSIIRAIKFMYTRMLKRNLAQYIADDKLREHMMPDYELGCRRVIPTNQYLPALSRDNVEVDISGIERINTNGIRTRDGRDIPLDVIIYATGFYAYSDMTQALSFQVYGRAGRHLNREWEQNIVSYKGVAVAGFPNYFKINGPNTGTGHSSQMSYMEAMVDYIVQAICAVKRDQSIKAIEPKSELQKRYIANLRRMMQRTVWQTASCTAFYRKNMTGEVTSLSPESVVGFIFSRKWFRLKDYELTK